MTKLRQGSGNGIFRTLIDRLRLGPQNVNVPIDIRAEDEPNKRYEVRDMSETPPSSEAKG